MRRAGARIGAALPVVPLLILGAGCSTIGEASRSDTGRAHVGDCVDVATGSLTDSQSEPIDCSADRAVYAVVSASHIPRDCGPEQSSYEETFRGDTTAYLCLAPNLKLDRCYHQDRETGFANAECASSAATVRVAARVDGRRDRSLCAPSATFLLLSEPETTFCLENVDN